MLSRIRINIIYKINQCEISNVNAKKKQINDCQKQTLMLRTAIKQCLMQAKL